MIMGGEQLVTSGDYYISLKTPDQVRDIAKALGDITGTISRRYRAIDPTDYGMDLSDDDEDTCDWFEGSWTSIAARRSRPLGHLTVDQ